MTLLGGLVASPPTTATTTTSSSSYCSSYCSSSSSSSSSFGLNNTADDSLLVLLFQNDTEDATSSLSSLFLLPLSSAWWDFLISGVLVASSLFLLFLYIHFKPRFLPCTNKAVLITGAASGIGKATADLLLSKGCFVYALDINKAELERVFAGRSGVRTLYADVTKKQDLEKVVAIIEEERRGLWAIVNSAGILRVPRSDGGACGTVELDLDEDIRPVFDVNFFGVHRVTSSLIPFVMNSKGRVVNISSCLGRFAVRFIAPYCASKFAIEGYSDCLRRELREVDVKLSIIEPGYTDTPLVAKERFTRILVDPYNTKFSESIASGLSKSMKSFYRLQQPIVVAEAIFHALFSSSPKPRYLVIDWPLKKLFVSLLFLLPDFLVDPIARVFVD